MNKIYSLSRRNVNANARTVGLGALGTCAAFSWPISYWNTNQMQVLQVMMMMVVVVMAVVPGDP